MGKSSPDIVIPEPEPEPEDTGNEEMMMMMQQMMSSMMEMMSMTVASIGESFASMALPPMPEMPDYEPYEPIDWGSKYAEITGAAGDAARGKLRRAIPATPSMLEEGASDIRASILGARKQTAERAATKAGLLG